MMRSPLPPPPDHFEDGTSSPTDALAVLTSFDQTTATPRHGVFCGWRVHDTYLVYEYLDFLQLPYTPMKYYSPSAKTAKEEEEGVRFEIAKIMRSFGFAKHPMGELPVEEKPSYKPPGDPLPLHFAGARGNPYSTGDGSVPGRRRRT